MASSGSKLVVVLGCVAVVAGATSWWYRYTSAHRATEFWGSPAAVLMARSDHAVIVELDPAVTSSLCTSVQPNPSEVTKDLSTVHGMAHLRHALLCDRNYAWEQAVEPKSVLWGWSLWFYDDQGSTQVLLAANFSALGKCEADGDRIVAVSCQPVADSLNRYFRDVLAIDASKPTE